MTTPVDSAPVAELDTATRTLLHAAIDRIIPADEFPSASQTGCGLYIMQILNTDLRGDYFSFVSGLCALDQEAQLCFNHPFARLTAQQQDHILTSFETGFPQSRFPAAASFLKQLVELTMQGFYSDPNNGGNDNAISWKMVGYKPGAQVRNPL